MRYGGGWANDPTWPQHKRAKPTYTDQEDDTRTDAMMPIATTSKRRGIPEPTARSGINNVQITTLDGVCRCHRHNGDRG